MNSTENKPLQSVATQPVGQDKNISTGRRWAMQQIGDLRYWLLLIAIAGQLATVIITWELWQIRVDPPNLPLTSLPQAPFAIPMVVTLAYMLIDPRRGFWAHVVLLVVASIFDQFRMQPQFLALVMLMLACVHDRGKIISRWFMAALWVWAGLHKLISPHWFAHASYWIVSGLGLVEGYDENVIHTSFAYSVGFGEIAIGLAAIFRPRWAAIPCVLMHLSILLLLIALDWNVSVMPWNIATAFVGSWVMWTACDRPSLDSKPMNQLVSPRVVSVVSAAVFLIAPAGFYLGWLDHGYSSVLYSDYVPRALITGKDDLREIKGWDPVHVPFPYERRTHKQFFEALAEEGDKLHISDPRPLLDDQYCRVIGGKAVAINRREFFSGEDDELVGIGNDDRWARFQLLRHGKFKQKWYKLPKETKDDLISYAYTLDPDKYKPIVLTYLQGLPNLSELQLAGCPVRDQDLAAIASLTQLKGIGLNNTSVTDEGLKHLSELRKLRILEVENTQISPQGLKQLQTDLGLGKPQQ